MTEIDTSPSLLAVRPGGDDEARRLLRIVVLRQWVQADPSLLEHLPRRSALDGQRPRRRVNPGFVVGVVVAVLAVASGAWMGWAA